MSPKFYPSAVIVRDRSWFCARDKCSAVVKATSARNRVTAAHAGKHLPKRVENAIHGSSHGFEILIGHVFAQQFFLGGRVFAVSFDVHAEVFVMFGIIDAVMFL